MKINNPMSTATHQDMNTIPNQLVLEISESLYQQLKYVATLSEESVEAIATRIIAMRLPSLTQETEELQARLASITPESLHSEVGLEEVGDDDAW